MIEYKCEKVYKDGHTIYGYMLSNEFGELKTVSKAWLKEAISDGKADVCNLFLTCDGKLINGRRYTVNEMLKILDKVPMTGMKIKHEYRKFGNDYFTAETLVGDKMLITFSNGSMCKGKINIDVLGDNGIGHKGYVDLLDVKAGTVEVGYGVVRLIIKKFKYEEFGTVTVRDCRVISSVPGLINADI